MITSSTQNVHLGWGTQFMLQRPNNVHGRGFDPSSGCSLRRFALVTASAQTQLTPNGQSKMAHTRSRIFVLGVGRSLPELKLHYLTLGEPHRDAAGHTDNAILLLHGTGGNAHTLLNPVFSGCVVWPRPAF